MSERRTVVKTYLTATEYARVKRDAKRADVSISTHIRHAIFSKRKGASDSPEPVHKADANEELRSHAALCLQREGLPCTCGAFEHNARIYGKREQQANDVQGA